MARSNLNAVTFIERQDISRVKSQSVYFKLPRKQIYCLSEYAVWLGKFFLSIFLSLIIKKSVLKTQTDLHNEVEI